MLQHGKAKCIIQLRSHHLLEGREFRCLLHI